MNKTKKRKTDQFSEVWRLTLNLFLMQAEDKALKEKIIEIHEEYAALVVRFCFYFQIVKEHLFSAGVKDLQPP